MTDLRYPIGKFQAPASYDAKFREECIEAIEATPARLRQAVAGLSPQQLNTPYRPGGWTVGQVVHHLPDSHLNAYIRTKLALTEDEPTIKPYQEARWAELADGRTAPIETSLALLERLHERWTLLLRSLTVEQLGRRFKHPDHAGLLTIDWMLAMYSWHGRHHVAHVTSLREGQRWN